MRTPLPPNAAMRWSVVRRVVRRTAPATILEIGCGQGAFGTRLARAGQYLAVEPDPTSYRVARSRIEPLGGEVRNALASDVEPGRSFDLVCAFEVVEHLEDDRGAVESWRDLVAPGGSLLISVPAWQDRFNHWDTMVGHYRRYSPAECRDVLTAAGFVDVDVIVYGWPLGYATESIRSRLAERRGQANEDAGNDSMAERTASSGRQFQPKSLLGVAVQAATAPFCLLQRMAPHRGTGLVAVARRAT